MPTDRELGAFHANAINEHLTRRSVALMLFTQSLDHPTDVGSGTCIKIGSRHLIATVAHNLEGLTDYRQVGVAALSVGKFSDQTPKVVGWGHRGGRASDLDVAWLEISPGAVEPWARLWDRTFVTLDRVSVAPVPVQRHVSLLGQPADYVKHGKIDEQPMLGFTPLPYSGLTIATPAKAAPTTDIFMEYPRKAYTEEGLRELPKAPGLSGSGLWLLNDEQGGLWTPEHAQLIGIETCWLEFEYLRGNPIREWLQMVREDLPELASEIDPVLAR
jgi:hypothetical protein